MVFISYLSARRRYNATEDENWLTPMLKGGLWCLISVSHHHFLFLRCYALTLHQQKLLQRTSHQIQVHASLAVHRKVVINAIDAEKNKNSCTMNKIIHVCRSERNAIFNASDWVVSNPVISLLPYMLSIRYFPSQLPTF